MRLRAKHVGMGGTVPPCLAGGTCAHLVLLPFPLCCTAQAPPAPPLTHASPYSSAPPGLPSGRGQAPPQHFRRRLPIDQRGSKRGTISPSPGPSLPPPAALGAHQSAPALTTRCEGADSRAPRPGRAPAPRGCPAPQHPRSPGQGVPHSISFERRRGTPAARGLPHPPASAKLMIS